MSNAETRKRAFVHEVLIERRLERIDDFVGEGGLIQHNPDLTDGTVAWRIYWEREHEGRPAVEYSRLHRILADGSFVLTVCEGARDGVHSAFYDLFRVNEGKLVEHWDTIEAIAPRSEWKHENGKF